VQIEVARAGGNQKWILSEEKVLEVVVMILLLAGDHIPPPR
jgi:hypothetical protein